MDVSLTKHSLNQKLTRCVVNIAVEGTVSWILYIGPGAFSVNSSKKYSLKKMIKS